VNTLNDAREMVSNGESLVYYTCILHNATRNSEAKRLVESPAPCSYTALAKWHTCLATFVRTEHNFIVFYYFC
jgi:hypothetical protein